MATAILEDIMNKNTDARIEIATPSKRKSDKFCEARNSLPDNLRELYDRLVDEYHFATIKKYGAGYVAYPVLAELIRSGWRPTAEKSEN